MFLILIWQSPPFKTAPVRRESSGDFRIATEELRLQKNEERQAELGITRLGGEYKAQVALVVSWFNPTIPSGTIS